MIPSQMLKGILEGCILKIISKEETYGYEISQKLQTFGFLEISEGTIYPLLLRLEKQNFIEAVYKASSNGPKRKYFHITELGLQEISCFQQHWEKMNQAVNKVLKGSE